MSNSCVANSPEVAAIFNSQKQASTRGLRNTSYAETKTLYKRGQLVNIVFNLQFAIVISFYFLPAFTHTEVN